MRLAASQHRPRAALAQLSHQHRSRKHRRFIFRQRRALPAEANDGIGRQVPKVSRRNIIADA